MMTVASPHLTDAQIDRFRRGELSPGEVIALGDHLAGCLDCRGRVAAGANLLTDTAVLLDTLGIEDDGHIPEPDIQGFVDGRLDPQRRADISAHLESCDSCAAEVRDLADFANEFSRSPRPRPRWTYGMLAAAAVLVLAAGAGVLWRTFSNDIETGRREADVASTLAPDDAARVRDALQSGRLTLPSALADLTGRQGTLLGPSDPAAFHLAAPVATVVLGVRPVVHWTALPGASSYLVTIQDQTTGETITSAPVTTTEWTAPTPLVRGRTYAWQVAASAGGREVVAPRPPAPPVRFMIAEQATAARFARPASSPLARGVLYASAGLLDDAEREFQAIASARGEGVDRAAAFLGQIRDARAPAVR
jgi:hypothetical protein